MRFINHQWDRFEDVICTAVSFGGDADTLTRIAGGIAEVFYGAPVDIEEKERKCLPEDMKKVREWFGNLTGKHSHML